MYNTYMRGYTKYVPSEQEITATAKQILDNSMNEADKDYNKYLEPIIKIIKETTVYYRRAKRREGVAYNIIVERNSKRSKQMWLGIPLCRSWNNDTAFKLEYATSAIDVYGSDPEGFIEESETSKIFKHYKAQQNALLKVYDCDELMELGACISY